VIFLVNRKLKIFGIITLTFLLLVGIVSASQESHALVTKGLDQFNARQYDDAISTFNKAISKIHKMRTRGFTKEWLYLWNLKWMKLMQDESSY
jgi:hypothetical protein